jgi:D-xylose reductase
MPLEMILKTYINHREHVLEMGRFQNETWGLGYIDLYLMHFPVALEYIEPSKLQYPVYSPSY